MRLLLFGEIRESAPHLHDADIAVTADTVRALLDWIAGHEALLKVALKRPGIRYAVDQQFVDVDAKISADSEVALMSPLSGG